MQFVSIRVITNDAKRPVEFYEKATGLEGQHHGLKAC